MVKMYTKHLSVYVSLIIVICDVCLSKVKWGFFPLKVTFLHVCVLIILYLIHIIIDFMLFFPFVLFSKQYMC